MRSIAISIGDGVWESCWQRDHSDGSRAGRNLKSIGSSRMKRLIILRPKSTPKNYQCGLKKSLFSSKKSATTERQSEPASEEYRGPEKRGTENLAMTIRAELHRWIVSGRKSSENGRKLGAMRITFSPNWKRQSPVDIRSRPFLGCPPNPRIGLWHNEYSSQRQG